MLFSCSVAFHVQLFNVQYFSTFGSLKLRISAFSRSMFSRSTLSTLIFSYIFKLKWFDIQLFDVQLVKPLPQLRK